MPAVVALYVVPSTPAPLMKSGVSCSLKLARSPPPRSSVPAMFSTVVAELLAARPLVLTPVAALVNNRPVSTRPVILTADWANTELATSAIMIAKIFFI